VGCMVFAINTDYFPQRQRLIFVNYRHSLCALAGKNLICTCTRDEWRQWLGPVHMRFMADTVALGQTCYKCCDSSVSLSFYPYSVLFIYLHSFFLAEGQMGKALGAYQ
jgi:hypothetical protein